MEVTDYIPRTPVLLAAIGIGCISYLAVLAFRCLWLSPLAEFPGPKLAALSTWYQFYYDVIKPGQLAFQISKLHDKYGSY